MNDKWTKLKKILGVAPKIEKAEPVISSEEQRRAILQKEKEEATAQGKPWVGVLDCLLYTSPSPRDS